MRRFAAQARGDRPRTRATRVSAAQARDANGGDPGAQRTLAPYPRGWASTRLRPLPSSLTTKRTGRKRPRISMLVSVCWVSA